MPAVADDTSGEAGAPDEATLSAYRQAVHDAVTEFDAGRWAEARALFLRAHELWPSARTFRALGMTSFELRDYPRALSELEQALSDPRRTLDEAQKAHVKDLLERAKAFVGTYRVGLVPADAELWVDARPQPVHTGEILRLALGNHDLVARAPGHVELHRHINVQGGEEMPLQFALTVSTPPFALPPAPAAPPRVASRPPVEEKGTPDTATPSRGHFWTWIAAGGAVALGGASAALWFKSKSDADAIKRECSPRLDSPDPCRKADYDVTAIHALETAHQITLGLALAAGASAVVLFVVEGDRRAKHTAVTLSPGSFSLHGRF